MCDQHTMVTCGDEQGKLDGCCMGLPTPALQHFCKYKNILKFESLFSFQVEQTKTKTSVACPSLAYHRFTSFPQPWRPSVVGRPPLTVGPPGSCRLTLLHLLAQREVCSASGSHTAHSLTHCIVYTSVNSYTNVHFFHEVLSLWLLDLKVQLSHVSTLSPFIFFSITLKSVPCKTHTHTKLCRHTQFSLWSSSTPQNISCLCVLSTEVSLIPIKHLPHHKNSVNIDQGQLIR